MKVTMNIGLEGPKIVSVGKEECRERVPVPTSHEEKRIDK